MKIKKTLSYFKLPYDNERRHFLSGLFFGILSFLTYLLFRKEDGINGHLAGTVKSVNGVIPDASGNVMVEGAAGSVMDYLTIDRSLEGGTIDKDNYNRLLALVNDVKAQKKGLYIPNGKYYVSKNLVIDGIQNVRIDGEIIMAKGKVMELVYDSRSTDSLNWLVNKVTGKLRLSGIKNGWIKVLEATELELYANGNDIKRDSIAYSQFVLGTIDKLTLASEGSDIGWINENNFFGGRIANIIIDGNYMHNNNTFIRPFIESANIRINHGSSNKFMDVRFEGKNSVFFSNKTHSNIIIQQWANLPRSGYENIEAEVTDNGTNNVYIHDILNIKERLNLFLLNNKTKVFNGVAENGAKFEAGLDRLTVNAWKKVFETELIPVVNGSMFHLKSDAENWRPEITVYDAKNKPITKSEAEYINIAGFNWNKDGYYYADSNVAKAMGVVAHPMVKYIKIKISSGDSVKPFRFISLYMMIDKVKEVDLHAKAGMSSYPISLSSAPTSGFASEGQLISKKTGGIWTCTKSLKRKLAKTALKGATSITVNDPESIANGDIVGILLDNGETHWTTVSGLQGSKFSITPLPSQSSIGKRIVFNTWV